MNNRRTRGMMAKWLLANIKHPLRTFFRRNFRFKSKLKKRFNINDWCERMIVTTMFFIIIIIVALLFALILFYVLVVLVNEFNFSSSSFLIEQSTSNPDNDTFELQSKQQREYIDKNGMHIIVGQFMGRGFPWLANINDNLTDDILNYNHYNPVSNMGENGAPVYVPEPIRSQAQRLFQINRFNLLASDMVSVNRSLPDVRKHACRVKRYNLKKLPATSVIIVFHNEAWSTLIRTVHSVILRSSRTLLHEIILVDDASQRSFLAKPLDDYLERLSNDTKLAIKIIRSKQRIGLIQARILGANQSQEKVLTFLDAHCEVTKGWLEPLLQRIAFNEKIIVCPVIDIINDQNFAYVRSFDAHWGAMNWGLNFRWYSIGAREAKKMRKKHDYTQAYRSPIMAGGLFAIDRKYFFSLGAYDPHLEIWGGENIEMSLRVWQCGGRVEIAPCSHVGHLFRTSSPYSFGLRQVGDVLYANLIRVAEVWLDEWKSFFYKLNPTAAMIMRNKENRSQILVNIQDRIELRRKLKCHSFEWYLNNIWPEHFFPDNRNLFGQIQSMHSMECLQKPSTGSNPSGRVIMSKCAIEIYGPQSFVIPKPGEVGFIKTDESVCLDVNSSSSPSSPVLLILCAEFDRQKWRYETRSNRLIHVTSGFCLTLNKHDLTIEKCNENNENGLQRRKQKWLIVTQQWKP